ncbi:MAG: hypothetical protein KDD72_03575 [Anaerolineales bacterium]|nr:hypothetical protein [Anaerolineales bacterium]
MKKALTISLAFLLTACGIVQPTQQEQPTPIVQTVVVVATTEAAPPTALPLPTQEPTFTPLPADTPTLVPTNTAEPTATAEQQQAANAAPASSSDLVPVHVDNSLGKGVFTDITFSTDKLTLNCYPREMEISMKSALSDITRVEMYYRIVDAPSGLYPSEWMLVGNLGTDNKGTFSTTFQAININPNFRGLDQAWIDFQFVGINKGGAAVDRTQKIERLVYYYKDCP